MANTYIKQKYYAHINVPTAILVQVPNATSTKVVVMSVSTDVHNLILSNESWIQDTGTTTHLTHCSVEIVNITAGTNNSQVVMGNNTKINHKNS